MKQTKDINQNWAGPKILISARPLFLAAMAKVLRLQWRLATRFCFHVILKFF